jgi:glycosyltransferase involved in cell wall biosynthesis
MKLKILILSSVSYPAHDSQLGEVYANILPDRGHEIIWVMTSNKKSNKNKTVYWNKTRVYLIPLFINKTSFFRKLINFIFICIKMMRVTIRLIKREKFDAIQARNGVLAGLLGIYIKKRYGMTFFYHCPSQFPEEWIQASKIGAVSPPFIYYLRGKIDYMLCKWIMSKADLVLPISKWMMQDLVNKGIPKEKMIVFPMGVNIEHLSLKISGANVREELKLNNFPTIIYTGTMGKIRGMHFLLRTIVRAKKKIPDIKLLMVGDGDDRTQLEKLAQSLGIKENVIFTGRVPRSQVPEYIAAADVGISPVPPLPIFQISSPTKLIEYMGMGKPAIGNDIPDQKEVIGDSGGGICTRYNEEEFAKAIIELLNNPRKAVEMGKAGREWVVRNRSYEILANNLEQRYFDILVDKEKVIHMYDQR